MYQQYQQSFYPQQPNAFYGGYAYAPRPVINVTQPVTADMKKMLNQDQNQLDIRISNVDKAKNWCTHKEPGIGRLSLVENADGTVTCRVCGETFRIAEDDDAAVEAACNHIIDIIQTIKTMYVDIPEEFLKGFSQIITMIRKIPDLWKRSNKNFSLYEVYTGNVYPSSPNMSPFAAASGILGGFNPIPQTPWGQQPMGYPMGGMPTQAWPMGGGQQPMPMGGQQGGQWATPPQQMPMQQQAASTPYIDPNGNVMPGMPMGPTTMNGNPMMPGFNPLMNNSGVPGNMTAPAPTGPQTVPTPAPVQTEPTQTKQMSV